MGVIIAIIGIIILMFVNLYIGGIVFLLGVGIEIVTCVTQLGNNLKSSVLIKKIENWINTRSTGDTVMIGIGFVFTVIIISVIILEILENI